jgi:hypothetical protein
MEVPNRTHHRLEVDVEEADVEEADVEAEADAGDRYPDKVCKACGRQNQSRSQSLSRNWNLSSMMKTP